MDSRFNGSHLQMIGALFFFKFNPIGVLKSGYYMLLDACSGRNF
jgi:hypothetical protein